MPKGIYSGFKANKNVCSQDGIIALLGYPARPAKTIEYEYKTYDLVYINYEGELVVLNHKDVLDILSFHKDSERFIPENIDSGDSQSIEKLVFALKSFLESQASESIEQENGEIRKVMGKEAKDVLDKLRRGDKGAIERVKQNEKVEDKFKLDKFDLITWLLVN